MGDGRTAGRIGASSPTEDAFHALRQKLQAETQAREKACERLELLVKREACLHEEELSARETLQCERLKVLMHQQQDVLGQQLAEALTQVCADLGKDELEGSARAPEEVAEYREASSGSWAGDALSGQHTHDDDGGQHRSQQSTVEGDWQDKLEAMAQDMRSALHDELEGNHLEVQRLHREALEQEVKEREEICHMLLTYLEDKIQEERRRWDERFLEERRQWEERLQRELQRCEHDICTHKQAVQRSLQDALSEERKRCEEGLCASEQVVQTHLSTMMANIEDRSGQALLTARQSLVQSILELRSELAGRLTAEREAREQTDARVQTLSGQQPAALALDRCALEEQHSKLRSMVESQETRLCSVHHDVYRELEKTASQSREVLNALSCTRSALSTCREEVKGLREGVQTLRAQASGQGGLCADSEGREEGSPLLPQVGASLGSLGELRAALEAEARIREEADDRILSHVREVVREERQGREQGHRTLELGVQSVKELLFVDSGKREERDRDIQIQLAKVDEDLDTVKRQVALRSR